MREEGKRKERGIGKGVSDFPLHLFEKKQKRTKKRGKNQHTVHQKTNALQELLIYVLETHDN